MVLLFHGDVGWMRGGYFGVSMFFTLSGFLITSLLVREFESSGRISPKAFYAAAAAPADAGQPAVPVGGVRPGAFDLWTGVDHLRRDTLGALFQVANWVQLGAGESYMDLQSRNAGIDLAARPLLVAGHRRAVLLGVAVGVLGPRPSRSPAALGRSTSSSAR